MVQKQQFSADWSAFRIAIQLASYAKSSPIEHNNAQNFFTHIVSLNLVIVYLGHNDF